MITSICHRTMLYSLVKLRSTRCLAPLHYQKEDVMAELRDVTFGKRVATRKTAHQFSCDFNAMGRRAVRLSGALTFAALSASLLTAPVAGPAATLSVDNAGGYTFTNFDPSLTGTAGGANVDGISN